MNRRAGLTIGYPPINNLASQQPSCRSRKRAPVFHLTPISIADEAIVRKGLCTAREVEPGTISTPWCSSTFEYCDRPYLGLHRTTIGLDATSGTSLYLFDHMDPQSGGPARRARATQLGIPRDEMRPREKKSILSSIFVCYLCVHK